MKKLYELAVRSGSYTTKDGNDKTIWLNIGSVWEGNDETQFMLLRATFNPAAIERKNGSDSIAVSMFPPRENEQRSGRHNNNSENAGEDSSDYYSDTNGPIPF